MKTVDVLIVGAGASGLMCAIEAGRRGRQVLLIDHSEAPAEKIRISGGGRCNFTNIHAGPKNFLSANPHFCKSALARYTPQDFLSRVEAAGIAWHEKTLGQLFCDDSSQQIIDMLLEDCRDAGVTLKSGEEVSSIEKSDAGFQVEGTFGPLTASSVVIASGGRSIPKMGASGFGYKIAEQFELRLIDHRPGLVPLTFDDKTKSELGELTGVSVMARVSHGRTSFDEALLFTHRGLSGPAILQISSYWREGDEIEINLAPEVDMVARLKEAAETRPKARVRAILDEHLPQRLAQSIAERLGNPGHLAELSHKRLDEIGRER